MGRIAFLAMLAEGAAIFAGIFLGGETWAVNLRAAEGVILGLLWTQTAIIFAYLGVSGAEAIWRRKG